MSFLELLVYISKIESIKLLNGHLRNILSKIWFCYVLASPFRLNNHKVRAFLRPASIFISVAMSMTMAMIPSSILFLLTTAKRHLYIEISLLLAHPIHIFNVKSQRSWHIFHLGQKVHGDIWHNFDP